MLGPVQPHQRTVAVPAAKPTVGAVRGQMDPADLASGASIVTQLAVLTPFAWLVRGEGVGTG